MVANMTISSHARHPHHSSPRKETASAQKYAWPFKPDPSKPTSKVGMGTRSGTNLSPDDSANSWETRAFADDASSLATGIWAPRAYPCSFCCREFRSAQALGGHMNVHRRDRARLRHSSPPAPTPYCAPFTAPQLRSPFQAYDKYAANRSAGEDLNQSFIKPSSAPTTPSNYSKLATNKPYSPLISNCQSDKATSFPLRLPQLASEAAAALLGSQQCESSGIPSIWPAPMSNSVSFACHSSIIETPMKERTVEVSFSSSLSSLDPLSSNFSCLRPSIARTDAASACRRDPPTIQPEDESPPKRAHSDRNWNHPIFKHMDLACRNSFIKDGPLHAHDIQTSPIKTTANDTSCLEQRSPACSGDLDLELRLRPP